VEAPREDQIPTDTDRPRQNRCPLPRFATHLRERGDHASSLAVHAVVMEARQCTSHPRCSRPTSNAPPNAFFVFGGGIEPAAGRQPLVVLGVSVELWCPQPDTGSPRFAHSTTAAITAFEKRARRGTGPSTQPLSANRVPIITQMRSQVGSAHSIEPDEPV
jgi:hypothetical protein